MQQMSSGPEWVTSIDEDTMPASVYRHEEEAPPVTATEHVSNRLERVQSKVLNKGGATRAHGRHRLES